MGLLDMGPQRMRKVCAGVRDVMVLSVFIEGFGKEKSKELVREVGENLASRKPRWERV